MTDTITLTLPNRLAARLRERLLTGVEEAEQSWQNDNGPAPPTPSEQAEHDAAMAHQRTLAERLLESLDPYGSVTLTVASETEGLVLAIAEDLILEHTAAVGVQGSR
jgi:hypothetical protein